jgi:hypothetical protein
VWATQQVEGDVLSNKSVIIIAIITYIYWGLPCVQELVLSILPTWLHLLSIQKYEHY